MELERAVGKLEGRVEQGFKSMDAAISKLQDNMELLLAWRWKLFGVTAAITIVGSGAFQLLLILIKHLNQ